ncbi:MAG: acyl-CoA/acyl-ACP dehydrogenase [Candidatus Omnitrophica bacterium]|nr:acyl-CoA/acyl-ACP dehydrogenase [Candidatus Omnitrophota bacterium]
METVKTRDKNPPLLHTLPGDDVRQILWGFEDRYDLQMVVQSVRSVARGIVARLVAQGGRNSHEWNSEKAELLRAFDEAGITAVFMNPKYGGYIEGPKNLALAMVAFELSWVDAGAATCSLAGNLALAPIHEKGTEEQREKYMTLCVPPKPGENRKPWRGAFVLTEPIPYVGVDTGVLSGKVRIAEWQEGKEPILQVEKRGRFITNMGFANFVTAAVDSDDPRIKGSCIVILENTDPGVFDPGSPTHKLVHQLSSTCDPIFSLKVPASRIIGGFSVKDGIVIPNFPHSEVIESVFKRTRVTVGIMTSAKLISAIEPVIRYQRSRFRGGSSGAPGTPRYELGLQQKEDSLHRLIDVWATGEASAALGFATAKLFDDFDPIEKKKDEIFRARGIQGSRAQFKALQAAEKEALEYLELKVKPEAERDVKRFAELEQDPIVRFMVMDSLANVLCPASKLWNTGHGANMMREAVSLMGGYGITEDCPGFLAQKWMDAQLEATYEGPEAVQRRQLSVTMASEIFLAQFKQWITALREIAYHRPGTGACTLASAMELWFWTARHLLEAKDAEGKALYHGQRHGVTFPLADALCWLLASRYQILSVLRLEEKGKGDPSLQEGLESFVHFFTDLCHVQAASAAGEVAKICGQLVFGYNRHPSWEEAGLAQAEQGCSRLKAGPCVRLEGMDSFLKLRSKLDGCLTGSRLAKDRAAVALSKVMIPEALDYPM